MTRDPTSDQPRWTVIHRPEDANQLLDRGTMAALIFKPHDADVIAAALNEVPGLRARLAELEAELADALDPEEEPYSSTRILEARLEAAEAVIRRLDDNWEADIDTDSFAWVRVHYSALGGHPERDVEPMTDAEAEAIARDRGDRP